MNRAEFNQAFGLLCLAGFAAELFLAAVHTMYDIWLVSYLLTWFALGTFVAYWTYYTNAQVVYFERRSAWSNAWSHLKMQAVGIGTAAIIIFAFDNSLSGAGRVLWLVFLGIVTYSSLFPFMYVNFEEATES